MKHRMLRSVTAILLILVFCALPCAYGEEGTLRISALLLPHFEVGALSGDAPGEAQLFYEAYFGNAESFELPVGKQLYYDRDTGLAMCVTGSGKTNCASVLTCLLTDPRFDWSEAYLFAFGCAGGARDLVTLGDVSIATGVCDNELGHTADIRDLAVSGNSRLWYHDASYDDASVQRLDTALIGKIFAEVKDIPLETTEIARDTMILNFGGAEWAARDPRVIPGIHLSGDNFWKGDYDHERALDIVSCYFPDEAYVMTEMEDIAIATVAERFGMLERCILMRVSVNPDVFIGGETPESLWGEGNDFNTKVEEENRETLDIFEPAMRNSFAVGSAIIRIILEGRL